METMEVFDELTSGANQRMVRRSVRAAFALGRNRTLSGKDASGYPRGMKTSRIPSLVMLALSLVVLSACADSGGGGGGGAGASSTTGAGTQAASSSAGSSKASSSQAATTTAAASTGAGW